MDESIAHLGLIDEDEILLDVAALEIAAIDHPDADLSEYLDFLDEITERALARAVTAHTPAEQAEALAGVIFGEFRFEGDRLTYDDPANADLISVIDRRRGMPIALSILYVAVARRIGWAADALNTPGHVLVGVGDEEVVPIDPFDKGRFVPPEQLSALLRNALGRNVGAAADHVAPMSNRAVLIRLLMNQASRAEQAASLGRALTIFRRITSIAPTYSHGWWERARLELLLGNRAGARESLSAMLETTRDPALRTHVNSALDALASLH
jgi:regulator of sirC expression with transglutaminase-like and TPR domain